MTSSTCWCWFLLILMSISSMFPVGISGILKLAKSGFFFSVMPRLGTELAIVYGPTPGGGLVVRFLNGVDDGTRPAKSIASTLENEPTLLFSLIVISPVLSSAVMPG